MTGAMTRRLEPEDRPFANTFAGLLHPQLPWPTKEVEGWPPEGLAPTWSPPPSRGPRHHFGTTIRWYVPWDEIEERATDPVDRLVEYAEEHWAEPGRRGVRIAPRVYLDFPQRRERRWPVDLAVGDYHGEEFRRRAVALVEKMGAAWAADARLAWVETGIVGLWGEQHDPEPAAALQAALGDAYDRAFPGVPLLRRYPGHFPGRGWGLYWDSFGATEGQDPLTFDPDTGAIRHEPDLWRTGVVSGEVAFDYMSQYGTSPDEAVRDPVNCAAVVAAVRRFHASALGWIGSARYSGIGRDGLDRLQCQLGHRLVVESATLPRHVTRRSDLRLSFTVRNHGAATFPRGWPVRLALLDPDRLVPVVERDLLDVDARAWTPGEEWDDAAAQYRLPPPACSHRVAVRLPAHLPAGPYVAALALVDPATDRPAARFANRDHVRGGWTPLGMVGVAATVDRPDLDPVALTDLTTEPLPPLHR